MATSGVFDGSDLRLFANTGSGTAHAIGFAQTCTADYTAEERETTSKDDTGDFRSFTPGQLSGTISFEALHAQTVVLDDGTDLNSTRNTFDELFTVWKNKTKIFWSLKTETSGDYQHYGYGYITSLSATATDKENATYSGTLGITGSVTQGTIT